MTTELVRTYRHICIEDTQTKNMTKSAKGTTEEPGTQVRQKAGLNREIHSQGWYGIRRRFKYKCAWNDRVFTPVPSQRTSTTCGSCGHSEKANRLSQAKFRCRECNLEANADVNAAENIRRWGTAPARPDDRLDVPPEPRKGSKRIMEGKAGTAGPTQRALCV